MWAPSGKAGLALLQTRWEKQRQSFSNVKSAATEKIIEVIKCVNFASLFSQHYSAIQKIDMERI